MAEVIYTDGGVIGRNPSELGGVWSYVVVDGDTDTFIRQASGQLSPTVAGICPVSNNISEMWAKRMAFASLPRGWSGTVVTDSLVSLLRWSEPAKTKMKGVPQAHVDHMLKERVRLGTILWVLIDGHPTVADLERGHKLGSPRKVSKWNKRCDDLCNAAKLVFDPSY